MAGIDKIRPCLEGLDLAAASTQSCQQRQRDRGFSDTAVRASNDQSRILSHTMSERDVKVHPHPSKNRADRSSEEKNFFVLSIEDVVSTRIHLDLLVELV